MSGSESVTSLARRERAALCATALAVGPDRRTLCGDWDVRELVVHLLVRERSVASVGIAVPPLARLTELESRRVARTDFATLVERLRTGPPLWSPFRLPKVDELANTLEFFVHHEDIRRAAPDAEPRALAAGEEALLWSLVNRAGRGLVRSAPVGVVLENATTGSRAELGGSRGAGEVVVRGLPSEVTLFTFGRQPQARVDLDGPPEAVAALTESSLGI